MANLQLKDHKCVAEFEEGVHSLFENVKIVSAQKCLLLQIRCARNASIQVMKMADRTLGHLSLSTFSAKTVQQLGVFMSAFKTA